MPNPKSANHGKCVDCKVRYCKKRMQEKKTLKKKKQDSKNPNTENQDGNKKNTEKNYKKKTETHENQKNRKTQKIAKQTEKQKIYLKFLAQIIN